MPPPSGNQANQANPGNVNVPITPVVNQAGLRSAKASFASLALELAVPISILTRGGKAVDAAWAGIHTMLTGRVLGPLSAVAGSATASLLAINKLAKAFGKLGLEGAANLEDIETKFKTLLKSQQLANERMRLNIELAKDTPYDQTSINEASRSLELLTQGAMANKDGMLLVGDAAALAGAEIAGVARWVGRLYDSLQSGAPIGLETMRLQEMGVITGQTRRSLQEMSESGAAFSEMWNIVENDLRKAKGAMEDLAVALRGVRNTYEDTKDVMHAKFSEGFLEGEKASLEAATTVMSALTPLAERLGKQFGWLDGLWARLSRSAATAVTNFKYFDQAVTALATVALGTLITITTASGTAIIRAAANLLLSARAANTTKAAMLSAGLATASLKEAKLQLALASRYVTRGEFANAAAAMRSSAAFTVQAIRTNIATVAAKGFTAALKLAWTALRTLTAMLWSSTVAFLAMPLTWAVGAFVAATLAIVAFRRRLAESKKELADFEAATDDIKRTLDESAESVRNLTDLMKEHAKAVNEVAKARDALKKAEQGGRGYMIRGAQRRLELAEEAERALRERDQSDLALSDDDVNRMVQQAAAKSETDDALRAANRETLSPDAQVEDIKAERKEMEEALRRARKERAAYNEVLGKQASASMRHVKGSSDLKDVRAQKSEAEKELADLMEKRRAYEMGPEEAKGGSVQKHYEEMVAAIAENLKKIRDLTKQEESLAKLVNDAHESLNEALTGGSEQSRMKARNSLREQIRQAQSAERQARSQLEKIISGEDKGDRQEAETTLSNAERNHKALREIAKANGVEVTGRQEALDKANNAILEQRLQKEEDFSRVVSKRIEEGKAQANFDLMMLNERVESQKTLIGLQQLGLRGTLRQLDAEMRRQETLHRLNKITDEQLTMKKNELNLEKQMAIQDAKNRALEGFQSVQLSFFRTQEEMAKRIGDVRLEAQAKEIANAIEIAQIQKRAADEAKDMFSSSADQKAYVDARVKAEWEARQEREKSDKEDRDRSQKRSRDEQQLAREGFKQRAASFKGEAEAATKARKEQERIKDMMAGEDAFQKYMQQGFGDSTSRRMAGEDVLMIQAQRELDKMRSASDSITASSMAKIGGGGNWSSTDPVASRLDKTNELLKKIYERDGIDFGAQ